MRFLAACAALMLAAHAAAAADVEKLFGSGTVVDGTGIYNVSSPRGLGKRLTFLGLTSSLVRDDGTGARTTIVSTGDPLPAPLTGTFNRIVRVAGTDGKPIAFFANLNTTGPESGFFVVDGGTITPAVLDTNPDDGSFGNRYAVNALGDIAYFDVDGLRRWQRSSGTITPIGIAGGNTLRNVAIDDGGAIVWQREGRMGPIGSIGYWSPGSGVVTVAKEGDPGPLGTWDVFDRRRTNIALDATHGLAFETESTSTGGAFLWTPPAGPLTVLAIQGDLVDGTNAVRRFRNAVSIEADGAVVFEASIGSDNHVANVRVKDGVLTEVAPPAPGPFYDVPSSGSVYERKGRRVSSIVKASDVVTDLGALTSIQGYDTDGRTTVVLAQLADARFALAWKRGKTLTKIVADGDALPFGTFDGTDVTFAVGRDTVGFVTSNKVVLKHGDDALQWLNVAPALGLGESWIPRQIHFVGKRIFLDGTLETIDPVTFTTTDRRALLEVTDTTLTPVIVEGEPAGTRKAATFLTIGSFTFAGPQILFPASDGTGALGIGSLRRGRATFVPTVLDPSPVGPGGPVGASDLRPLGGSRVAFATTLQDATATESLPSILTLAHGVVAPLLVDGESTNLGVVDLSSGIDFTTIGRTVVVAGSIPGTRSALLARRAGK
jgi:hypothetical protein